MSSNQILYPDGTFGDEPKDNTKFYDSKSNETYTWDALLNSWVNSRGEMFHPEYKQISLSENFMDYIEPVFGVNNNSTKANGCECGSWIYGPETNHSDYCPLYKKIITEKK